MPPEPPGTPPAADRLTDVCTAAGWDVQHRATHGSTGTRPVFFHTVFAVRGDQRVQVDWVRGRGVSTPVGPWVHHRGHVRLRHPDHDPADFVRYIMRAGSVDPTVVVGPRKILTLAALLAADLTEWITAHAH